MKKLFLLFLAVISITLCASAQTRTVTGTVLDASNDEPLVGVSVQAGTGYGAVTDIDGNFTIKVPASTKNLTVSYVGYKTQTVAITGEKLNIVLHPSTELLDEVIAVAYGTAKRSAFTGSAAVLSSAQIEKTQATNALDALAGKVAGLQLSNASGAPGGSNPTIRVRGFSSLLAGNDPLVIVDGTPYTGDINSINANDIESMSVLKDAASNALYGARGANGVILITTKRAKLGEAQVTVDVKWGANHRGSQDYNYITDPRQYFEQYYKALYNYASYPVENVLLPGATSPQNIGGLGYTPEQAHQFANNNITSTNTYGLGYNIFTVPTGQQLIGLDGRMNPNATLGYITNGFLVTPDNWMDETYKTSLRQEYNVNITQGTDKSNILASISYLDNDGIVYAPSDYARFTGRLSADFQAKPYLKIGGNVAYSHINMNSTSSEGASNSSGNIFAFSTKVAPIYPMYMRDANGNIMVDNNGITRYDYGAGLNAGMRRPFLTGSNAISDANLNVDKVTANNFLGTAYAEVRFLKDFKFTSNNNVNLQEARGTSTSNPFYGQFAASGGIVDKSHTRNTDYTFQQMLNWDHKFGDHSVALLAGHEWYKQVYEVLTGRKTNMFLPSNDELNGSITDGSPASYSTMYNNEGWFFRGQYDYDNKYFGSASYRRDASSRFHPKHRWGNFWSVGGAWIISKESFLEGVDWINTLKVKASYGEQGNDNIGNFRYIDTYSLINANGNPAASPETKGNETITWEKGGNFNAGVEFALFDNRLSGSFEGFWRKTTDMLMYFPLPASSGFMGYYDNVGDMTNSGIEIELAGELIRTRDFTWSMNLNFTWYKNRITRLPEERKTMEQEGYRGYQGSGIFYGEGLPMYTLRMKKYAGVNPENGIALYYMNEKDSNGNPTGNIVTTWNYDNADFYLCGTTLAPVYGGFSTQFEYKGFDLSAAFNYQIGGQVLDSDYGSLMGVPDASSRGTNIHADIFNAWTPTNTNTNVPRYMYGDLYTTANSDRFLVNASYLSLENINFGYTLPSNIVKKLYLSKLRVYFAASNLWVWSKRQGLDPRQSFTGSPNNTYYAPIRTLSGGFTVTF